MNQNQPRTELNVAKERFVNEIKAHLKNGKYFSDQSRKWFKECLIYFLSPNRKDKVAENSSFALGHLKGAIKNSRYKKPWLELLSYAAPKMVLDSKHQEEMIFFLVSNSTPCNIQCFQSFCKYDIKSDYDKIYNAKIHQTIDSKLQEKGTEENITKYYEFMSNYARASSNITPEFINKYVSTLLKMSEIDKNRIVKLKPLYDLLCKKALENKDGVQQELFSDIKAPKDTIDKRLLLGLIDTFAKEKGNKSYHPMLNNFTNMYRFAVANNSFSNEDINKLSDNLEQDRGYDFKLSESFNKLSNDLKAIYDYKKEDEINRLNQWAFDNKSNDFVEKLSLRSTYINILYEKLVKDNDITHLNPNKYYENHKAKVQKDIKDLVGTQDKNGKVICHKYALNKVYKLIGGNDKVKLENIQFIMKKYHSDSPYYDDVHDIISAFDGGKKNRNIRQPIRDFYARR